MIVDGWREGRVQWWWKYVFPVREQFWLSLLASKFAAADPSPDPWFQNVAAEILEGVAMLQAAAVSVDPDVTAKLKKEAAAKINHAMHHVE